VSLRYFLPAYLFVYLLTAFVWRSFAVWKRTGINPVVFKRTDSAHDYIGRIFKLLFALIVIVVLVYSFWPNCYRFLMPIEWLERSVLRWIGVTFLMLSLVWTMLAQAQMGHSWRIGIDEEHRTSLVVKGVFGVSRNPIFLGMIVTLVGLFLIIPNAVTLLTLVLGVVLIQVQIRLEEAFLGRVHGNDYEAYRRKVRRWV
jgi:protein-S-isoprenylcysteine O-methyltransferase Ste14